VRQVQHPGAGVARWLPDLPQLRLLQVRIIGVTLIAKRTTKSRPFSFGGMG
jgi:hypothetical protein